MSSNDPTIFDCQTQSTRKKQRAKKVHILFSLLAGVIVYSVALLIIENGRDVSRLRKQELVNSQLNSLASLIGQDMNASLHALFAIESIVNVQKDHHSDEFKVIGNRLIEHHPYIDHIQLSPGGIISSVYPKDAALAPSLGGNILEHPNGAQRVLIEHSIKTKMSHLAGPIPLAQGRNAVILRLPIFNNEEQFWGFVAIVIDFDALSERYGHFIKRYDNTLIGLKGVNGQGKDGDVIFGSEEALFALPVVERMIDMHHSSWLLVGYPKGGWDIRSSTYYMAQAFSTAVSLLLSLLTFFLLGKNNENEIMAKTDQLTGSFNRYAFIEFSSKEIQMSNRYGAALSLIVIDIDFFKKINDERGHLVGDWVLQSVAATIGKNIRGCDMLARIGGEEFCVVCPSTDLQEALIVAEKLRKAVENLYLEHKTERIQVTISAGVATYGEHMDDVDALVKEADMQLYKAKETGRNKVVSRQGE